MYFLNKKTLRACTQRVSAILMQTDYDANVKPSVNLLILHGGGVSDALVVMRTFYDREISPSHTRRELKSMNDDCWKVKTHQ